MATATGIRFAGRKWFKTAARGIVTYVQCAGIGGSGIVKPVINAPTASRNLASTAAAGDGGDKKFWVKCIFLRTKTYQWYMFIEQKTLKTGN
jgi:hypothetical protein